MLGFLVPVIPTGDSLFHVLSVISIVYLAFNYVTIDSKEYTKSGCYYSNSELAVHILSECEKINQNLKNSIMPWPVTQVLVFLAFKALEHVTDKIVLSLQCFHAVVFVLNLLIIATVA